MKIIPLAISIFVSFLTVSFSPQSGANAEALTTRDAMQLSEREAEFLEKYKSSTELERRDD